MVMERDQANYSLGTIMANSHMRPKVALTVERLETREMPSASPLTVLSSQNFDTTAGGTLPGGWSQWQSQGPFAVWSQAGFNQTPGMAVAGSSNQIDRAWFNTAQRANVQVSADVFLNSLIPAQILARGSGLTTAAPTYYAVTVERGVGVALVRTVHGVTTTLAHLQSVSYLTNRWVQVSLQVNGTNVQAFVQRLDTGAFLNARGQWQGSPTPALSVNDTAISGAGLTGLARPGGPAGQVNFDDFWVLGLSNNPAVPPPIYVHQGFDNTPNGLLPAGWWQYTSTPAGAVQRGRALSGSNGLDITGVASESARAWVNTPTGANAQVSTATYLSSLIPSEVFLRGSNLASTTPSYYALAVTRGVQVELLRVLNGTTTVLGYLASRGYVSGQWVQISLQASGSTLQASVQRLDTHQYLAPNGQWQWIATAALTVNDAHITGAGYAGVAKGENLGGTIAFDNFAVSHVAASASLGIAITSPRTGALITRPTNILVTASNYNAVSRVEFYLDNVLRTTLAQGGPFTWTLDPSTVPGGDHLLTVIAYDLAGHAVQSSLSVTTRGTTPVEVLNTPQHYSWIRLAELAYSGTPLGAFEAQLLRNSIDLVIPNAAYLSTINSIAHNTPQLIYTNVSSIYGNLLLSWDNWAEAHGISPESAFYHVTAPTVFSGDSSGSQPVNWFWGVYEGGAQVNFTDLTSAAHTANDRNVALGPYGTSLYIGYPDRYREINFNLASGARNGWAGVLQYATGVDANGNPTGWANLPLLTDTTQGLTRSGQITFDPPAGWAPVSVNGSARMYYIRILTVHNGSAPLANTILGRDYVDARGGAQGIIPAFDYAADRNHDGYLNNAEYAVAVAHGYTARFVYETRLFQPYNGQERFAINPSSPGFAAFAVQYYTQLLNNQPLADGFFVDNSTGKRPATPGTVLESVSDYSRAYGALLNDIGRAIAPRWLIANTSGGDGSANSTIQQNTAYFVESAIRPLADNWQRFEDLANQVTQWESLRTPAPYAVLDSLPTGGAINDPRTQIATLAEYYLVGSPQNTFLDFYGGYSPASSWSQHWTPAVTYNVGQPEGGWSVFATGSDPSNRAYMYKVYQRKYTNALVLYRPLSHSQGNAGTGTTGDASAVTLHLGGTYRPLQANGRLGAPVTSVWLRNGEGAILVKV
jgi:hypothetical protein